MLTDVVACVEQGGHEAAPVRAISSRPGKFAVTTALSRPPAVRTAVCVMSASPRVVGELRVATVRQLRRWGAGSNSELVDLVQLAVSELVTNAIKHGPCGNGARISVTWGMYRGGPGPDRVTVSVLDGGRGGLRIRDSNSDGLFEGQYGLPLLLRSGLRIEPTLLPGGGGHLVSAWTPVRARTRTRVCACPCWEHGYQTARCEGLISGTRHSVVLFDGFPVACCMPCVAALNQPTADDTSFSDSAVSYGTPAKRMSPVYAGATGRG